MDKKYLCKADLIYLINKIEPKYKESGLAKKPQEQLYHIYRYVLEREMNTIMNPDNYEITPKSSNALNEEFLTHDEIEMTQYNSEDLEKHGIVKVRSLIPVNKRKV